MNMKTIFELSQIEYRDRFDDDVPPSYPSFEADISRVGFFSSLAAAEEGMQKQIASRKEHGWDELFGFWVYEFEVDKCNYEMSKSKRNYLPDGSLLDECLTSEIPIDIDILEEFNGRPTEKLRYRPGDLVEVLHGDTVTLEIVGATPCTPEKVSETKNRMIKEYGSAIGFDASDDCYYTMPPMPASGDADYHSHPSPVMMFPVRFPVSDELKGQLEVKLGKCRWE
jgi:hypothetical protein